NPSNLHHSNSSDLGDYPKLRKRLLYENGIIQSRPFQKQYIFYPKSLSMHFAKSFREYLLESLKDLAPQFDSFQLVPFNDTDKNCAYSIYKNISKAIDDDNIEDGGAILILPDHIIERGSVLKNLHDCVKKEYYPKLRFQCVSAAKLQSFLYSSVDNNSNIIYNVDYKKQRIFSSYINNLLYKFLILNSKWPYALSKGLNYDIYIGIDAHDYYAGFCFLYKKGEHIVFDYENVPRQTGTYRNEKIGASTIRKVLLRNLDRHIPLHAKNPNGIVILRDGRSFGEEEKALEIVIEQLATKGILDSRTIKKGVIDVSKQSLFPIRTVRTTNGYSKYSNVAAGKYKALNSKEAFLFNTGYPFHIAGSSNPLHILQRYGDTDFKKVLEDIFHQSMLAFSAPDKSSSLPVTLKIVDTLIRSFAHQTSLVDLEQDDKEAFENYKYN
ncbi:MAG TPA: hypothetical protein VEP89_18625, partial [Draconibacterium sp.]|nr:hypothetical protein [Draconibacterium sp.]